MENLGQRIKQKIEECSYCENDKEYLFALGYAMQNINNHVLVNKLVKDHNIKRLLTAEDEKDLHNQFMLVYKKYFVAIPSELNSLFALVITYKLDNKEIEKDIITQGYLYTA